MLNAARVAEAREAIATVRAVRLAGARGWQATAARWLDVAAEWRRTAHLWWDYTVTLWVCDCCTFTHAAGECCDSAEHGGDSMVPLSEIKPEDGVALGIFLNEHSERCTDADRDNGCDCETDTFSRSQCDGCGSWLGGTRHAMTLFVNERRNSVSV